MNSVNQGILLMALQESSELRQNITMYFSKMQHLTSEQGNMVTFSKESFTENLLYFEATAQMIEVWLKQLVIDNKAEEEKMTRS